MNQPPMNPQHPSTLVSAQAPKKGMSTLVIVLIIAGALMVVGVFAVGVVAALGIYGVRKYVATAKTAEAKNNVGAISRAAVAAFEREGPHGHALCASRGPEASGHAPVPQDFHLVQGKKYMPSASDFNAGTDTGGWRCLKFAVTTPMYYQLSYASGGPWATPHGATAGPHGFEAAAKGDLDGNGKASVFVRTGTVTGNTVALAPQLYIENEFE